MKSVFVDTRFFEFESDFVDTLRCIPMIIRYKLDTCGVKLKLPHWVKFSKTHKEMLAHLRCHTGSEIEFYKSFVTGLIYTYTGTEALSLGPVDDCWNNSLEVPAEVAQKAEEGGFPEINISTWMTLDTLQRFALVKLSRSGHESSNFPVALREFGIY
jgi:hypothetical protein